MFVFGCQKAAATGRTRYREPPGKPGQGIAVVWSGGAGGSAWPERDTRGAAGRRLTGSSRSLQPLGCVIIGRCLILSELLSLISRVWVSPPPNLKSPFWSQQLDRAIMSFRVSDPLCLLAFWGHTKALPPPIPPPGRAPPFPGGALGSGSGKSEVHVLVVGSQVTEPSPASAA